MSDKPPPLPPLPATVRMEVDIPQNQSAAFLRVLNAFLCEQPGRQLAQERASENAIDALRRLYAIACRDSGQCRDVAAFLAGLYNGDAYPFSLTALRSLDDAIFEDCMTVLRLDARQPVQEIHLYLDNGGEKFKRMITDWGITPVER